MSKEKETKNHAHHQNADEPRDAANPQQADAAPFNNEGFAKGLQNMADMMSKMKDELAARRPTPNPLIPPGVMNLLSEDLLFIREIIEYYAANIRPLDRARINGVGIKKQGFIERAFSYAEENDMFMPKYLTIEKFQEDFAYFNSLRTILELINSLREFVWNLLSQAADVTYTDALEFYATVREASERRIDGAENIFVDLRNFFKSRGSRQENGEAAPTEKQLVRDFKKALHGEIEGEVGIRNVKPKVIAGEREIIDKKFAGSEHVKETKEAEIEE